MAMSEDDILENGAGKFSIEIDGCPTASANIHSISMEDLTVDVREVTSGKDWDYRKYGPGDCHYGHMTIRSRVGQDSKELYEWWMAASIGSSIRKNISVVLLKRDGSEARRFNCFDCFPVTYDPGEYSPTSNVAVETVVVNMGRVELA